MGINHKTFTRSPQASKIFLKPMSNMAYQPSLMWWTRKKKTNDNWEKILFAPSPMILRHSRLYRHPMKKARPEKLLYNLRAVDRWLWRNPPPAGFELWPRNFNWALFRRLLLLFMEQNLQFKLKDRRKIGSGIRWVDELVRAECGKKLATNNHTHLWPMFTGMNWRVIR